MMIPGSISVSEGKPEAFNATKGVGRIEANRGDVRVLEVIEVT